MRCESCAGGESPSEHGGVLQESPFLAASVFTGAVGLLREMGMDERGTATP